jgi:hypothetical protein
MPMKPRTRLAATIAAAAIAVPASAWASTIVFKTMTGSTDRGTTVNISDHGNVLGFAGPVIGGDYEHMKVGTLSDGYVLCYRHPTTGVTVNAFDLGSAEAGFGPPLAPGPQNTVTPDGLPGMQVTRRTTDGVLELKQSFVFYGKEKRMLVAMDVVNRNPFPITGVVIRRQADFDVDSGGADGWAASRNLWARTSRDAVFAWTEPSTATAAGKEAHGMLMTHRASHVYSSGVYTEVPATARTAKVTEAPLDSTCNPAAKTTPVTVPADDGGTLQFNLGTIAAAPSAGSDTRAEVAMWYQRI